MLEIHIGIMTACMPAVKLFVNEARGKRKAWEVVTLNGDGRGGRELGGAKQSESRDSVKGRYELRDWTV